MEDKPVNNEELAKQIEKDQEEIADMQSTDLTPAEQEELLERVMHNWKKYKQVHADRKRYTKKKITRAQRKAKRKAQRKARRIQRKAS